MVHDGFFCLGNKIRLRLHTRQIFRSGDEQKSSTRDAVVYLLGDDGVVVLKNEPLDLMGPQALLLHRLGLKRQALVV